MVLIDPKSLGVDPIWDASKNHQPKVNFTAPLALENNGHGTLGRFCSGFLQTGGEEAEAKNSRREKKKGGASADIERLS